MKFISLFPLICAITVTSCLTADIVYVAENGSDQVSVVDTSTNSIVTTIPVGIDPIGVVASPDGTTVYVTNSGSNSVSVIDTGTNTVTTTIPLTGSPYYHTISADGSTLYVPVRSIDGIPLSGNNGVSVINTGNNTVTTTVPLLLSLTFFLPIIAEVQPNSDFVYVVSQDITSPTFGFGVVQIVDTSTNTEVPALLTVGRSPYYLTFTPDGSKAYISNNFDNTVSVIDTLTPAIVSPLNATTNQPKGLLVSSDGSTLYVGNGLQDRLVLVDTSTDTGLSSESFTETLEIMKFSVDGLSIYATSGSTGGNLYRIDTASPDTITQIVGGLSTPLGLAVISEQAPPIVTFTISGVCLKERFLRQINLTNIIEWETPEGDTPITEYRIYRDEELLDLIGTVSPDGSLCFQDPNRSSGVDYTYFVVGVDGEEIVALQSITISCPTKG